MYLYVFKTLNSKTTMTALLAVQEKFVDFRLYCFSKWTLMSSKLFTLKPHRFHSLLLGCGASSNELLWDQTSSLYNHINCILGLMQTLEIQTFSNYGCILNSAIIKPTRMISTENQELLLQTVFQRNSPKITCPIMTVTGFYGYCACRHIVVVLQFEPQLHF